MGVVRSAEVRAAFGARYGIYVSCATIISEDSSHAKGLVLLQAPRDL